MRPASARVCSLIGAARPLPNTPHLQEAALSSRPGLLAAIEELEKMTAGLKEALKEELTSAAADARKKALAEAEAGEPAMGLGTAAAAAAAAAACRLPI